MSTDTLTPEIDLSSLQDDMQAAADEARRALLAIAVQIIETGDVELAKTTEARQAMVDAGFGVAKFGRLMKRLENRRASVRHLENARAAHERVRIIAARKQAIHEQVGALEREYNAARNALLKDIPDLESAHFREMHVADELERDTKRELIETAGPDGSKLNWRNCSLEFSTPPAGMEHLPTP